MLKPLPFWTCEAKRAKRTAKSRCYNSYRYFLGRYGAARVSDDEKSSAEHKRNRKQNTVFRSCKHPNYMWDDQSNKANYRFTETIDNGYWHYIFLDFFVHNSFLLPLLKQKIRPSLYTKKAGLIMIP